MSELTPSLYTKMQIQFLMITPHRGFQCHAITYIHLSTYKLDITGLRIPTGRRQTSWLFTSVAEDLKLRFSVKQIQLVVKVGLELRSSGLEAQHSNRSVTTINTSYLIDA